MSSYNYEKALSLEWNGQVFVLTVRNETPVGINYLYSSDGTNWTPKNDLSNSTILTTKNPFNIKWLGSNFAMIGNLTTSVGNTILRSVDGVTFSPFNTNTNIPLYDLDANLEFPHTITFPKNVTLALGGISSDTTKIAYSLDGGSSWSSSANSSSVFSNTANNAAWNGRIWVAVGSGGNTIATSNDGNYWVGRGSYIFTTSASAIAWSSELVLWVAGGAGGNSLAYSRDAVYWTGIGSSVLSQVLDVQWNGSIWVAAGIPISGNKSLAYSYDGINWALPTQTDLFDISGVKVGWNGSFWTAVGRSSSANSSYNMATSNNGIFWNMENNSNITNARLTNIYTKINSNTSIISGILLPPLAPTNLAVSSYDSTTVSITFTASANTTTYTVTATPASGSIVTQTFSAPATSYTITGLNSNTSYTIYLVANNNLGSSTPSSTVSVTTSVPSPLDSLSTQPSVAYGLRKLKTSYTGNCITICDSAGGNVTNIGFVNGIVDMTTVNNFKTARGNVYVKTWYDQTGNNNHLTQNTVANMPQIANSSAVVTTTPFISFHGSGTGASLIYNSLNITSVLSSTNMVNAVMGFSYDGFILSHSTYYYWHGNSPDTMISSVYASSSVKNGSCWYNGTSYTPSNCPYPSSLAIVELAPQTASSTGNTLWDNIGLDRITHPVANGGGYSELIVFSSAVSTSDRQALENNQKNRFGIL